MVDAMIEEGRTQVGSIISKRAAESGPLTLSWVFLRDGIASFALS